MAHPILHADDGPRIAYHLGQHPEEAQRISRLNPVQQAYEIGKLAQRIAPRAQISRTAAPIRPLGSNAAVGPKTPDEETMEEYAARRQPQILAARRGGFIANAKT